MIMTVTVTMIVVIFVLRIVAVDRVLGVILGDLLLPGDGGLGLPDGQELGLEVVPAEV